jgi:hydroxymethylpyrimidine/phosphomethylpyrimidine kinase
VAVLTAELLPLACLVTPNLPEAELLVGDRIADLEGARRAAAQIRGCGCGAVLLKGGHLDGDDAIDVLCDESGCIELASPRIETRHTHGTGCTYSAAIATRLGLGAPLRQAVGGAKEYITEAIRHAPAIGHGHGPVDHFYFLRRAP